jgi:hypothetical protein
MAEHGLIPFSQAAAPPIAVVAGFAWDGPRVALTFRVTGAVDAVRVPKPEPTPGRTDGLWQITCFEAFIARADGGYYEVNLSPSGDWALYALDAYRTGLAPADTEAVVQEVIRGATELMLIGSAVLPDDAIGPVGLSAVIETRDGQKSYWALAHPSDKPDFHHPDSFTLVLPAPESA